MGKIWKAITTKSYMSCSHPKDLEEWIISKRSDIQEFFRIIAIRWQRIWNHDWVRCPFQLPYDKFVSASQKFRWFREPNGDKTCEYCGSWHPDEFLKFIDKVIKTKAKEVSISLNDRRDKIYINRKEIKNASEGAIKFKMAHLTKEQHAQNYLKINEALKLSNIQFMKRYE